MAKTIWKQVLEVKDVQEILVPEGAEFLCAREQCGAVCAWYLCDPSQPIETRKIAIVGTGHRAHDGQYIGTASLYDGQLMFHVFVLPK